MRSWFDIETIPIELNQEIGIDGELRCTSDALKEPQGLPAAVSMVHAMLAQAESMGYPPTRIVLAGFSQGGALALLAGRLYAKRLGGVISLAGWHLRPSHKPNASPNHTTPIMLLHGTHDETVPIACLQESVDLLLGGGHTDVTYHNLRGEGHGDCAEAHRRIEAFLTRHVPDGARIAEDQRACSDGGSAAQVNLPAQSKTVIKMGRRRGPSVAAQKTEDATAPPHEEEASAQPPPQMMVGPSLPPTQAEDETPLDQLGPQLPPAMRMQTTQMPILSDPEQDSLQASAEAHHKQSATAFHIGESDGAVRVTVPLPPTVTGMAALDLSLDVEGMELAWPQEDGSSGFLRVAWPRGDVDVDAATAKWSKKRRELKVAVPY